MERHFTWQELHDLGILPSRQHTRRLIAREIVPKPLRLGDPERGRLAWSQSQIQAYLARKALESEQPRPRRQFKVVAMGKREGAHPRELTPETTPPEAADSAAAGKRKPGRQAERFAAPTGPDTAPRPDTTRKRGAR